MLRIFKISYPNKRDNHTCFPRLITRVNSCSWIVYPRGVFTPQACANIFLSIFCFSISLFVYLFVVRWLQWNLNSKLLRLKKCIEWNCWLVCTRSLPIIWYYATVLKCCKKEVFGWSVCLKWLLVEVIQWCQVVRWALQGVPCPSQTMRWVELSSH